MAARRPHGQRRGRGVLLATFALAACLCASLPAASEGYAARPTTTKGPKTIVVGGLTPATDPDWGMMLASAFTFAIDLINNRTDILPNYRIVPQLFDTDYDNSQGARAAFQLVGAHAVAAVGPATSRVAKPAASVLRAYKVPLVSMSATDPELANKPAYDFFARNAPSDTLQGKALVRFMLAFGWRAAAILNADEPYGQNLAKTFAAEAQSAGLRVLAWSSFSPDDTDITKPLLTLKASGARVIAVFNSLPHDPVFLSAQKVGMIGPEYVFLGGDGMTTGFPLDAVAALARGALGFQPDGQIDQPPAQKFLDQWSSQDPAVYYKAGTRDIDIYALFAVDAVNMVAAALDTVTKAGVDVNSTFAGPGVYADNPFGEKLRDTILSQKVSGVTGPIALDEFGDRITTFTVVNYILNTPGDPTAGGHWERVGRFDFTTGFTPLPGVDIQYQGDGKPYDGSCTSGSAPDASGTCALCPAGTYAPIGSRTCIPCPIGSYSAAAGSDRCQLCSPGTAASIAGLSVCEPCKPGTFAALTNATACAPCAAGTYENRVASVACTPADVDEYVPVALSTKSTKCPTNSLTNRVAAANISDCSCLRGFYSVQKMDGKDFGQCYACPDPGGVCEGGPILSVASGYWRLPWDYHSLVACDNDGCVGGADSKCAKGYIGTYCATCDYGYGGTGQYDCGYCASPEASAALVFIGIIGLIVIAGVLSWSAVKSAFKRASQATIVLRLLIDHMQLNSYVQSIPMRWPDILQRILTVNTVFNNPVATFINVDCVMAGPSYPRERVYFLKAAGYMFLPLLCFVIPVLAVSVMAWMRVFADWRKRRADRTGSYSPESGSTPTAAAGPRPASSDAAAAAAGDEKPRRVASMRELGAMTARKVTSVFWPQNAGYDVRPKTADANSYRASWADYYIVIMMVSIFLVQPSVAEKALDIFRCKGLSAGRAGVPSRTFVRGSMDTACLSADHISWLVAIGFPGIVVIVVGFPALWTWILWRGRGGKLSNPKYCLRYSFLFEGYRHKTYYWEIIQVYRKLFLVIISVFMADLADELALTTLAFFIFCACVDLYMLPFEDRLINMLNMMSLGVNLFTIYCGMIYRSASDITPSGETAVTVLVVLANLCFFIAAAVVLFRAVFILAFKKIPFINKRLKKASVYRLLRYTSQPQEHFNSVLARVAELNAAEAAAADAAASANPAPRPSKRPILSFSGSLGNDGGPGDEGDREESPGTLVQPGSNATAASPPVWDELGASREQGSLRGGDAIVVINEGSAGVLQLSPEPSRPPSGAGRRPASRGNWMAGGEAPARPRPLAADAFPVAEEADEALALGGGAELEALGGPARRVGHPLAMEDA